MAESKTDSNTLARTTSLPGAVLLGLGSMLGSGAYIAIALAVPLAGQGWALAVLTAAFLALFNGLSSARLATAFPKSGGAYEYGYRLLHPAAGFTAGWAFLLAKSASAATAAIALTQLLLHPPFLASVPVLPEFISSLLPVAIVLLMTVLAASGLRRSNTVNLLLVTLAILGLAAIVYVPVSALAAGGTTSPPPTPQALPSWLQAAALLFVAFTGYGRVATMGEEIKDPGKNIPRAVLATVFTTAIIYLAIAWAARHGATTQTINTTTFIGLLIFAGALAALLGVLLNLILGLSRVALAMGRRGDLPNAVAKVNASGTSPTLAVWLVGIAIAILAGFGSIKAAWSFSAFTVLIYYGILNLCALRLASTERKGFVIPILGLIGCLSLAFFVEPAYWIIGLAVLAGGLVWHMIAQRQRG